MHVLVYGYSCINALWVDRSISEKAPQLWNSFSHETVNATSLHNFKLYSTRIFANSFLCISMEFWPDKFVSVTDFGLNKSTNIQTKLWEFGYQVFFIFTVSLVEFLIINFLFSYFSRRKISIKDFLANQVSNTFTGNCQRWQEHCNQHSDCCKDYNCKCNIFTSNCRCL